eukprot:GGOE01055509.1.p4 GENE.GGOE01055509.1~~GGOE01055509.1.p4  ORF type:complete len:124 (-),score=24.87 GGOE01055509.1:74-445(-)
MRGIIIVTVTACKISTLREYWSSRSCRSPASPIEAPSAKRSRCSFAVIPGDGALQDMTGTGSDPSPEDCGLALAPSAENGTIDTSVALPTSFPTVDVPAPLTRRIPYSKKRKGKRLLTRSAQR